MSSEPRDTSWNDASAAAIRRPAEGFWLGATCAEPCDQTIESAFELARFYPGSLPEPVRLLLAELDCLAEGREAPFAAAFGPALDRAAAELAPRSKGLARRQARRKALLAAGGSERDAAGLSFLHHADDAQAGAPHWGCLLAIFDACACVDSNRSEFWAVSEAGRARALAIAERTAELALDALEAQWGLPKPLAVHIRRDSRIHWGASSPPSCLDSPDNLLARALAESAQIAAESSEPSRGPRKPGL